MTTQITNAANELLEDWLRKSWLRRIFLPGDFLEQVGEVGSENLVCQKTATEYLTMSEQVETKTVRGSDAGKYSTNINYLPQEFKNETIKIITNNMDVGCGECSGRGAVACPTTMRCGECKGSGQRSGRREECTQCDGNGEVKQAGFMNFSKERCMTCSGSGKRMVTGPCGRCGGRGQEICNKCNGSGSVSCGQCEGLGKLVQGDFITRKFSCLKELTYQLSGLGENEFKNGLAGEHFKSMAGDEIRQEFQTPSYADTVLQRETVHSYDVLSHHYVYRDEPFCLNRITSAVALKYVASGVPLSKVKVAVIGALASVVAVSAAALLVLL